jgi:hypothetical protein
LLGATMDSESSNADRTARYVHGEKLKQQEEGADANKKMSCRWFLDRSFFCVSTSLARIRRVECVEENGGD